MNLTIESVLQHNEIVPIIRNWANNNKIINIIKSNEYNILLTQVEWDHSGKIYIVE